MEGLREFLQSSTIHGLAYIGSDRTQVRIFWLGVVIAGFTGSFILINQSFSSWAESPITTTIDTLPIYELEFPNVTVCPPRNSFTNLNLDIVRSSKLSLSEGQRQALSEQVSEVVFASHMERKLTTYTECEEEDRYRNQYQGLSKIQLPATRHRGGYLSFTYRGERKFNSSVEIC